MRLVGRADQSRQSMRAGKGRRSFQVEKDVVGDGCPGDGFHGFARKHSIYAQRLAAIHVDVVASSFLICQQVYVSDVFVATQCVHHSSE